MNIGRKLIKPRQTPMLSEGERLRLVRRVIARHREVLENLHKK
jgi:hypothetical protein